MKSLFGILFVAFLVAMAAAAFAAWRRWVVGQWRRTAARIGGRYSGGSRLRPGIIEGEIGGSPLRIAAGISFEDGPAYHHTAAVVTCPNPGAVALGVRRKSVLEQFTSRHDPVETSTGDADFDTLFFVICNDRTVVDRVLGPETRARLKPLDEVELYVRDETVVVRRAGERRVAREMVEMAELAGVTAAILSTLPHRSRSLVQRMEDEELLKEGI